jgi:predicted nuclease of restriction endonuclease-like RecB superfamily
MSVRRSKKGILRSVFLTEENSDYCSSVIDLFSKSMGRSRGEIEEELKTMELKVQNPKILRGLALIMFRASEFRKPSPLDSEIVRKTIFSMARNPIVNPGERKAVLEKIASLMNSSVREVDDAIYGDKESNLILASPFNASPDLLARKFNGEQIETVIMKSLWVEVSTTKHSNDFTRSIRSKGLLYEERTDGSSHIIRVNGPVSIFEKSERYGVKLALFVRYVLSHDDWELNASISLKSNTGKKVKDEFLYHLDESISDLISGDEVTAEKLPSFVNRSPKSLEVDGKIITPDYSVRVGEEEVPIFVTPLRYYSDELLKTRKITESGTRTELLCLLEGKEKCPKGAMCFKDEVDWWRVREYIAQKYSVERAKPSTQMEGQALSGEGEVAPIKLTDQMISHLNSLYPDDRAMVEYLDFMGIPPEEGLRAAGFEIAWKGLRLVVTGRMSKGRD